MAYYGISERYRPEVRQQARAGGEQPPTILHVGSLITRKNIPMLLHAFQAVVQEMPDTRLVLIGRGPEEANLRGLAQALGIASQVEFAGFVSEAQKLERYATSDLLVSASSMEGFGLAVGEAMACGLPVVVTNAGSLPELVVDGESGLVVPVDDAAGLAASMVRVLRDRALAAAMGRAGIGGVEAKFRWDKTAQQTLAFYQQELSQ